MGRDSEYSRLSFATPKEEMWGKAQWGEAYLWSPKETHEKDLAYKEQLVDQKLQAALEPKELEEKRLVARIPKFSITPSKRAVIDCVHFNNRL